MMKRQAKDDADIEIKEEQINKRKRSSDAIEGNTAVKGENHDVNDDQDSNSAAVSFVVKKEERKKCPYLDTVNRQLLDFDMEKVCSVTLSNLNVYCCLICGKYFQGRGRSTPAYTHSVAAG